MKLNETSSLTQDEEATGKVYTLGELYERVYEVWGGGWVPSS